MAAFKPSKKGVVTGTKKKDKIVWQSSKDWKKALTVNALAGNDTIDFKKSKYKNNKLNGGDGNDTIYGGSNIDIIKGGKGNDKLYGYNGNDKLYGEAGNDTIYGGNGNDTISAGDGDDRIYGNAGNDVINAGKGKNNIYYSLGDGNDIIQYGGGTDTLVFDKGTKVSAAYLGNNLKVTYSGTKNGKVYSNTITIADYKNRQSVKTINIGGVNYSIKDFEGSSISLSRGDSIKSVRYAAVKPYLNVTLTNPFDGENYTYRITSNTTQTINLKFLSNGRLRIEGNYLNITAGANQADDIILWGKNNTVSTNDLNDIVRIGGSTDSGGDGYLKQSDFNTINTGAGDNYIVYRGVGNKINGGAGSNSALAIGSPLDNVNNAFVREVDSNIEDSQDYNIGWFNQGAGGGDCRLLSLILSIAKAGENYNDYVSINQYDNKYAVTFAKCGYANKRADVYFDELPEFDNVHGDLDVVLTDLALNKLISSNSLHGETTVANARYNTLADYFLGNEKVTYSRSTDDAEYSNKLNTLWNEYNSKGIKDITIGINSETDYENGIIGGHAYTLKDLNDTYISLINVWDSYDVLNLDLDTFYGLDTAIFVYGWDYYNENIILENSGTELICSDGTYVAEIAQETASWQDNGSSVDVQTLYTQDNKPADYLAINSFIQDDLTLQMG